MGLISGGNRKEIDIVQETTQTLRTFLRRAALVAALLLLPTVGLAGKPPYCPEGGTKIDVEGPVGFSCGED